MNCLYCNDLISKQIIQWVECKKCGVVFINFNDDKSIYHIRWERIIDSTEWALNIYPNQNYSILVGSPINYQPYFGTEFLTEIEFNHIINVNPKNVLSKIKTIIMFS